MKQVTLEEVTADLQKYLRMAQSEDVVIVRQGQPAGLLIGFESADDWDDYRIEGDPRFLSRVAEARQSLRDGRGVRLEDLSFEG